MESLPAIYLVIVILSAFAYGASRMWEGPVSFKRFAWIITLMIIFPVHAAYKAWTNPDCR